MDHVVGSQNHSSDIVAVTSVPPAKLTEPRQVCQILFNDETNNQKIHLLRKIEGCYQIVLYYENVQEEDHDWCLTGWIVESLARALLDHPLLAGRLEKRDINAFEIVSNDSGIRLLEANYPTTLSEFLELNEKECDDHETELVFWNGMEWNLYSIGISCSLLLLDILVVQKILNKWAQIHNMLLSNEETDTTIFNRPRLKNPKFLPSEDLINHTQNKSKVQSVVFKVTTKDVTFSKELWRELAMFCIEEMEQKLDMKIGSSFTLVVKESFEAIEVESLTKSRYSTVKESRKNQIICITSWNDFGVLNEVIFHEENKAVHVSCWVGCVADAHVNDVMIVPCLEENAYAVIIVSPC